MQIHFTVDMTDENLDRQLEIVRELSKLVKEVERKFGASEGVSVNQRAFEEHRERIERQREREKRALRLAEIMSKGVMPHPHRPLSEAEKQGLTEEEIFQKEYGLYSDFVYNRKWIDKFKETYGREPVPR